jgi:hypothetical protein
MRILLSALLMIAPLLSACDGDGTGALPKWLGCGDDQPPSSEAECECAGGRVAYGVGPGPECEEGERRIDLTDFPDDAIPVEGAACCLPPE